MITDRRQPAITWGAVFAGTAIAVGIWGVLQLLGIGVGLVSIDPDDATSVIPAAIGTSAFSIIAPLVAMFVGGFVAARLANTTNRRVALTHGGVVWGLASIAGLVTTVFVASALGHGAARMDGGQREARIESRTDGRLVDARAALAPINARLREEGKPAVTTEQLVAAARMAHDKDGFEREKFIEKLDESTALDEADATRVVDQLGPRAPALVADAPATTPMEHDAMKAAVGAGKGLVALGIAMLLGGLTALAGALVALRERRTGVYAGHTTAQYPTAEPPVE